MRHDPATMRDAADWLDALAEAVESRQPAPPMPKASATITCAHDAMRRQIVEFHPDDQPGDPYRRAAAWLREEAGKDPHRFESRACAVPGSPPATEGGTVPEKVAIACQGCYDPVLVAGLAKEQRFCGACENLEIAWRDYVVARLDSPEEQDALQTFRSLYQQKQDRIDRNSRKRPEREDPAGSGPKSECSDIRTPEPKTPGQPSRAVDELADLEREVIAMHRPAIQQFREADIDSEEEIRAFGRMGGIGAVLTRIRRRRKRLEEAEKEAVEAPPYDWSQCRTAVETGIDPAALAGTMPGPGREGERAPAFASSTSGPGRGTGEPPGPYPGMRLLDTIEKRRRQLRGGTFPSDQWLPEIGAPVWVEAEDDADEQIAGVIVAIERNGTEDRFVVRCLDAGNPHGRIRTVAQRECWRRDPVAHPFPSLDKPTP